MPRQWLLPACLPLSSNFRACSFLGTLTCSVLLPWNLKSALVFLRLASAQDRSVWTPFSVSCEASHTLGISEVAWAPGAVVLRP